MYCRPVLTPYPVIHCLLFLLLQEVTRPIQTMSTPSPFVHWAVFLMHWHVTLTWQIERSHCMGHGAPPSLTVPKNNVGVNLLCSCLAHHHRQLALAPRRSYFSLSLSMFAKWTLLSLPSFPLPTNVLLDIPTKHQMQTRKRNAMHCIIIISMLHGDFYIRVYDTSFC